MNKVEISEKVIELFTFLSKQPNLRTLQRNIPSLPKYETIKSYISSSPENYLLLGGTVSNGTLALTTNGLTCLLNHFDKLNQDYFEDKYAQSIKYYDYELFSDIGIQVFITSPYLEFVADVIYDNFNIVLAIHEVKNIIWKYYLKNRDKVCLRTADKEQVKIIFLMWLNEA